MSTNISNKLNSQQMSQMIQEGAVNVSLDQIKSKDEQKKSNPALRRDILSQVLDAKNASEAGKALLTEALSKFVRTSYAEEKSPVRIRSENEDKSEAGSEDVATIKTNPANKAMKQIIGKIFFSGRTKSNQDDQSSKSSVLEDYADAYFEYLTKDDIKSAERLKKVEIQLKEQGFDGSNVLRLQKEIKALVRADLAVRIKENFIKMELSGSEFDKQMVEIKAKAFVDSIFWNDRLGGWDFGGYNDSLQGTIDKAKEKAFDELGSFALDELEQEVISAMIKKEKGEDPKTDKKIKQLMKLCQKFGIDINEWGNDIWSLKRVDLGLNLVNIPNEGIKAQVDTNTDDLDQNREQKHNEEDQVIDEKTLLMNRLRTLYLKLFLNRDLRTYLSTSFKIIKVKGELFKLGINVRDLDAKISVEAEGIARQKIMETLAELFLERATLFKLDSTSSKLIEEKIKALLKNGEKLGMTITKDDLKSMEQKANSQMLDFVRKQIADSSRNNEMQNKFKALEMRLLEEMGPQKGSGDQVVGDERSQIA